ncbi:MAG TPA: hypothetical protein VIY86_08995, partial [Pirellulaceae bacterium]
TFALTALVGRLDVILLSMFSTLDEVGIYTGGQTLALVPQLFGTYLAIIFGPKVMPYVLAGGFRPFLKTVQFSLAVACCVILIAMFLGREWIAAHILPRSFAASMHVILILLPAALASMSTFPLVVTFLMFVKPKFLIAMECALLIPVVVLYLVFIPRYGAVGAASVTTGFILLKSAIALWMTFVWAAQSPGELSIAADSG